MEEREYSEDPVKYWRKSWDCFVVLYRNKTVEIRKGDIGFYDLNKIDGAIHAAIGCKNKKGNECLFDSFNDKNLKRGL